mgnify:CR=1 FL=1
MGFQHDMEIDNSTGANVRADINNALKALANNSSGSSAPSTTYAYQWWADTSNNVLKIRNSANNAWIELLQLDGTLTLEDGSVSTPALAFRDDLNTGIFSSAADTFNVATAGVERMELGATTIFNESGADVDFRIEGDSEANLFYVDAGNDRIGIGTSSPRSLLDLGTNDHGSISAVAANYQLGLHAAQGSTGDIGRNIAFIAASGGQVTAAINSTDEGGSDATGLAFFTGNATSITERLRVDESGQCIIGTSSSVNIASSSGALLQVEHTSGNIATAFYSTVDGQGPGGIVALGHGRSSAAGALVNNDVIGEIRFAGGDGGDCQTQGALIRAQIDGSPSSNNLPAELIFYTNSGSASVGQRLLIDKSGNIGAPSGTNIYNASDLRLKKNVVDLDKGLSAIKSLRPVSFNWIDGFCDDEKDTLYGFIAQEVKTIDSNLIQEFGDGSVTVEGKTINDALRVNEKFIIPMLVKAVQELEAKVAALETA